MNECLLLFSRQSGDLHDGGVYVCERDDIGSDWIRPLPGRDLSDQGKAIQVV